MIAVAILPSEELGLGYTIWLLWVLHYGCSGFYIMVALGSTLWLGPVAIVVKKKLGNSMPTYNFFAILYTICRKTFATQQ